MIWDPIRCCHVEATPEEIVRQKWILAMIGPLGYPKGLLSVEKAISHQRRIDILCYTPGSEGLIPLLLIECKAEDHRTHPEKQIQGYNFTVQAPFLCVIQGNQAKTFWKEKDELTSVPFLPPYGQLVKCIKNKFIEL